MFSIYETVNLTSQCFQKIPASCLLRVLQSIVLFNWLNSSIGILNRSMQAFDIYILSEMYRDIYSVLSYSYLSHAIRSTVKLDVPSVLF